MKSHRQGRTGAVSAVSRDVHARRLWAVLRRICRQLRRMQRDPAATRAYREVERHLAGLERNWGKAGNRR